MLAALVQWAVYGVLLMAALATIGGVRGRDNGFVKALLTAAGLSLVATGVTALHVPFLGLLWPVLWLLIVKSVYGIGWLRAMGVALVLVVLALLLMVFVLVPLGLVASLFGA